MIEKRQEERYPNCIMIVADQLRYDMMGHGFTPNIDALIKDSVDFPHTYCASPLCVPARGALFTGTYPSVNGSLINGWYEPEKSYSQVKPGIDHLYNLMEKLGMECIHSGKQHLFVEGEPLEARKDSKTNWITTEQTYKKFLKDSGKRAPGGPRFRTPVPEMNEHSCTRVTNYSNAATGIYEEEEGCYFDEYFTDEALRALKGRDKDKPLFLSMMYLAPHPPLEIPQPWFSLIDKDQVVLPPNVGTWYEHQSPLQKYNVTGVLGNTYLMDEWTEAFRTYMGLVALLDHCVGRIINELKEQGIYEESLILFLSDHGEMLGSHCLFQKMCMYEESARTPFSIHLPHGLMAGMKRMDYISHVDILPTICDFYGIKPSHQMDGRSIRPLLTPGQSLTPSPVFIQYDGNASLGNYQRCVIWKSHKLIVDIFKDEVYFELYDLENDIWETENLLFNKAYWQLGRELELILRTHMSQVKDSVQYGEMDIRKLMNNYK